ncbi:MAG TPA: VCBS repeat-containing protein [Gemmataceae bacterium]
MDALEARAVPAVQIVDPVLSAATAAPGQVVTVEARYRTENPANDDLNGLPQLRLHYDSSKFAFATGNVTDVLAANKFGGPTIEADTQDFDGNPATDKYLFFSWLSLTGENFPDFSQNPAPVLLYRANFTVAPGVAQGNTTFRFTGDPVDGSTFRGGSATVNFSTSPPPPPPTRANRYAVGAGFGGGPVVQVYDASNGQLLYSFLAFDPSFTGGVRVAVADVNGDGVPDVIAGTGPGAPTLVRVFDGATQGQVELFSVQPFEPSFTGGVYVAAGDLDGDGKADVVITPDEGGGPRVRVFRGGDFAQINDFFGIEDLAFRGGARAALADVNGDGVADLLVAAGFGGGPRIAVFDGRFLGGEPVKLFGDFFVFENTLRNGVFISGGDLDGDGFAEVIAGGGPGGGPRIFALSGRSLVQDGSQFAVANFFAGDVNNRGGIRPAVKNADGDNRADLFVGPGTEGGALVTGYLGKDIVPETVPPAAQQFISFDPAPVGGVYVG